MPRLRDWLNLGIFLTGCRFASLEQFQAEAAQRLPVDDEVADGQTGARLIGDVGAELVNRMSTATCVAEAEALAWCIGSDLMSVSEAIVGSTAAQLANVTTVDRAEQQARDSYRAVGLDLPSAQVSVVDEFPRPYEAQDWNAMAPDAEDEEKYGISPGIYVKASRITPVFTHVLVAHELVHLLPASVDPAHFPMGLEEGIADVLSAGYFASHTLGTRTATRHIIYVRLGHPQPELRTLYADALQRAAYLYRLVGLRGIGQLLRRGRQAIHDAEQCLISGELDRLGLDVGNWDSQTTSVLETALNAFPRLGIVSPLAMWLLQYVETGKTLAEISEAARVAEDRVLQELEGVACSPRLLLLDESSVNLSNVRFYLDADRISPAPTIRYECA